MQRYHKVLATNLRQLWSKRRYLSTKAIRIGCASGFWGDSAVAAPQLIHHGKLDFLVFDYLSEITMSLLTAAKLKNPDLGYAPDFVQVSMAPYLKELKKKGIRVISNAGGVNPQSCAAALAQAASSAGIQLNIAVVTGDDLLFKRKELQAQGVKDIDSGLPLPESVNSMTAYLGAFPIKRALDLGADVVITGRCTDSALALGPLLHQYNWSPDNFDLLAAGSVAGHLIECGAQSTGGIFTDWDKVPDWHNIGFPIVECQADGQFVVTKPAKTGGLVSRATVAEQLVYEIGDPASYLLPDVTCDFTQVSLEECKDSLGVDGVRVTGAKGKAPTSTYKVSSTYAEGYRATAVCVVQGPRSRDKARKTADAIIKRVRGVYKVLGMADFTNVHCQVLGAEESYGPNAAPGNGPREGVVWLGVHHRDKKALEVFAREIAPAGTGMAPGLCAIVGGRPKVSPVFKLFSFLHNKDQLKIDIHMNGRHSETFVSPAQGTGYESSAAATTAASGGRGEEQLERGTHTYTLGDLAFTRSGDKGNKCNIGVIARRPEYVPYLRRALTTEAVHKYFGHLIADGGHVTRYELSGIGAFNFVLHNSLGGGGIASLRPDPQGKAYGQMLLDFKIDNLPRFHI